MNYKILIIAPSWIGDAVLTQPLIKQLITNHSDKNLQIDVFAHLWVSPIYKRIDGINQIINNPFEHKILDLKKRSAIAKEIKQNNYDQVIVLPNSLKSALIPFLAKIPKRTGFVGEMRYLLLNNIRSLNKLLMPLMAERYFSLAFDNNKEYYQYKDEKFVIEDVYPILNVPEESSRNVLIEFKLVDMNLSMERRAIAICPGAEYGTSKQWIPEYFAEISAYLINQGYQIWVMGSQKDQMTVEYIQQELTKHLSPRDIQQYWVNFCGKTTLLQAIDLMNNVELVVTNDSGLMHIATGLKKPLISIFGSTSPEFTPPLSEIASILQIEDLKCRPCFKRECPQNHHDCMKLIQPEQVIRAFHERIK